MPSPNLPAGFDFTDPDIYAERLPIAELAEMRKVAPIWWNEQPEGIGGFGDGGYWVVTKHKDVKEVSRRSDVFSSQEKTALPRYAEGASRDQIDASRGIVLLNMDAPHHTHLRKIISRAFTPRAIELLRADLAERAGEIAAKAAAEGSGDFVEQVSCELPLQAIAGLMGVPQDERKKLFDWSNQLVGDQDPEFASNDGLTASAELMMYGMQLAAERADSPAEDLVTKLIQADVEGTFNLLDNGNLRQGGKWTEEGAIMMLDFFARLESLGVETLLLGFLSTHPAPQFRLPIVQNTAQQWRSNGGKAPALPFRF